jgi:hypothetical protein
MQIVNGTYSAGLCSEDCLQQYALKQCHCLLPIDRRYLFNESAHLPFCNSSGIKNCVANEATDRDRNMEVGE